MGIFTGMLLAVIAISVFAGAAFAAWCTEDLDNMQAFCKYYCQSQTGETCSVEVASSEQEGLMRECSCYCGGDRVSYYGIDCSAPPVESPGAGGGGGCASAAILGSLGFGLFLSMRGIGRPA
ncbi:MAG: hypothetical protein AB1529_07240 [Candidatus Micrarchaeota archaeon]